MGVFCYAKNHQTMDRDSDVISIANGRVAVYKFYATTTISEFSYP
jgi:hypothetical protein